MACILTAEPNEHFTELLNCMAEHNCMAMYPDDGMCLATDDEALQSITDIAQVEGDWWVLKGLNCGQDETWYGGADWLPCQHGRNIQLENGNWINNTTYCNGKNNTCTSDILVTLPELSLISPGVVRNDYPKGEAPLIPQVKNNCLLLETIKLQ